jgi:spermidine/putrescine-binding protein
MTPHKSENEELIQKWGVCDQRYLQSNDFWKWMVGVIAGSIVIITSVAFAGGRWGMDMEKRIEQSEVSKAEIQAVIRNTSVMILDTDTLKNMIRNLK